MRLDHYLNELEFACLSATYFAQVELAVQKGVFECVSVAIVLSKEGRFLQCESLFIFLCFIHACRSQIYICYMSVGTLI